MQKFPAAAGSIQPGVKIILIFELKRILSGNRQKSSPYSRRLLEPDGRRLGPNEIFFMLTRECGSFF